MFTIRLHGFNTSKNSRIHVVCSSRLKECIQNKIIISVIVLDVALRFPIKMDQV